MLRALTAAGWPALTLAEHADLSLILVRRLVSGGRPYLTQDQQRRVRDTYEALHALTGPSPAARAAARRAGWAPPEAWDGTAIRSSSGRPRRRNLKDAVMTARPQADHTVHWTVDERGVLASVRCTAEVDAPCRRGCAAYCDAAPACEHPRVDLGYCTAQDELMATRASMADSYAGGPAPLRDGPIDVGGGADAWSGDRDWRYSDDSPAAPGTSCVDDRRHRDGNSAVPEVVVLCGSTRFYDEFQRQNLRLTLQGRIVLSIGCDLRSERDLAAARDLGIDLETAKAKLDELHKRKIDRADRVLVIDVDGYIGASTRSEIDYAQRLGLPVEYLVGAR